MVNVYVEGGDKKKNSASAIQCREGFRRFVEKAGFTGRMPAVKSCGSRTEAFDDFKKGLKSHPGQCVLLVDSEEPIATTSSWKHVKQRVGDQWEKPPEATDNDLHFMAQTMEAWFYADKDAIVQFYERDFVVAHLSGRSNVEEIPKNDLYTGLTQASKGCTKGSYSKGGHSFKILALIEPTKVRKASKWADRFLKELEKRCSGSST